MVCEYSRKSNTLLCRFLAPGVGAIGPIQLDPYPFVFRRDLLSHEAHRHPYIELFGLLCLLKLRCGNAFGSRAHASWRLLFVLTLMPWLKQYRVRGFNFSERIEQLEAKIIAEEDDQAREILEKKLDKLMGAQERSVLEPDGDTLQERNKLLAQHIKQLSAELKALKEGHSSAQSMPGFQVHEMTEL